MSDRKGNWIQTYTGKKFWILDPRPGDFCKEDIAHALSMKCRYNGHSKIFYSVAQHCVLATIECLRRYSPNYNLALWMLLHDLGEAYLPDIPTPIKQMEVGILNDCEKNIMTVAAVKYGLKCPEPPEIKIIDNVLLATEVPIVTANPLMYGQLQEEPIKGLRIESWLPATAEHAFLEWWQFLSERGEIDANSD